jgi:hypothetical protein
MPRQPFPPIPLETLETRLIRIEALVVEIKQIMTEILQRLKARALQ